ncbi:MAG: hypothetical protein R2769_10160 [Saprospiraceae bacterium]
MVSSDKNQVSLSDYEGKNLLVLFFHWHLQEFVLPNFVIPRDDIASYNKMNTDVVAISVDSFATLGNQRRPKS